MTNMAAASLPTEKPLISVLSINNINTLLLTTTLVISLLLATNTNVKSETIFNFTTFTPNHPEITLQGDADILPNGVLALTDHSNPKSKLGRALYPTPITLWDSTTGNVASFETSFSFVVTYIDQFTQPADGLIFFLSPEEQIPYNSGGGNLGVANGNSAFVGVEFDSFSNGWDPDYPHIGMDVNSVISWNTTRWNLESGVLVQVSIVYDSHTKTLSAALVNTNDGIRSAISLGVDLKAVLQKKVWVGLSATTGTAAELHDIHSWSFSSNFEDESSSNNIATYK